MSNLLFRVSLYLLCVAWLNVSWAQTPNKHSSTTLTLKNLYAQGEYEKAFELGSQHTAELEGDPDFDFYYGLAALESGHYPEAQFVFERLTTLFPDEDRFRLEYARSLFKMHQYKQAKIQFNLVLENNPPATVRSNIERFIEAIEVEEKNQQPRWSGSLSFGGGYDTNINNATTLQFIDGIVLDNTAREIESPFVTARMALEYSHPITQNQSLNFSLNSLHKYNTKMSDFNLDIAQAQAFWKTANAAREIQLGFTYLQLLLDSSRYQQDTGIFTEWRQQWSQQFLTFLYVGAKVKDYKDNPQYESYQPFINFSLLIPQKKFLHTLSIFAGTEDARNDGENDNLRDFEGASYRLTLKTSDRVSIFGGISAYWAQYKADHDYFGEARDDDTLQFISGADWKLNNDLNVLAEVSYADNSSSLEIYEYDRIKSEVRLRWQF